MVTQLSHFVCESSFWLLYVTLWTTFRTTRTSWSIILHVRVREFINLQSVILFRPSAAIIIFVLELDFVFALCGVAFSVESFEHNFGNTDNGKLVMLWLIAISIWRPLYFHYAPNFPYYLIHFLNHDFRWVFFDFI